MRRNGSVVRGGRSQQQVFVLMNSLKIFALCAVLLYPHIGIGQTDDVVPAESVEAPAKTAAETEVAPIDPAAEAPVESPETAETPAAAPAEAPAAAPAEAPAASAEAPDVAPAAEPAAAPVEAPAAAPAATTAPARDFSTIRPHLVVVKDGIEEDARQAPGFSISGQGHILTDSGALRSRDTYLVTIAGGQVFSASALNTDEDTGLMLIRIAEEGYGLTALPFARTALVATAPLHAVRFNPEETEPFTSVAGSVTQLPAETDESPLIIHNALFNVTAAGTPLLNRCWEAVGVNVLQRKGFPSKRVDPMEQGSARSLPASWLSAFLASADLSLDVAVDECLSLEEETRLRLEQVQQEKEAALQAEREQAETRTRALAEEAQRKEEELSREKEAVEQQLAQTRLETEQALQAEREAAEAEREAAETERLKLEQEAQQRLEQAQQDKEQAVQAEQQETELARQVARQATDRGKQILLYSLAAGLALVLVFLLVMRARRKRLQGVEQEKQQIAEELGHAQADLSDASEREQLRAGAPDVLVEGVTPQGERIALKIPGVSLVEQNGAVVGRSPAEAAFIINHEQVSRRHFRLLLVSGQVMIEDLGSTNGTSVNGIPLDPGAPQPLGDGSRLQTGNLALTVRIGP